MMAFDVVGLVPAAGTGSRLAPLPFSKELYPLGPAAFARYANGFRPRVVSEHLLGAMCQAGASRVFIVLRKGKWDIPAYFEDGSALELQIAYLMMSKPYGVPFTLDQAYPFIHDSRVVFGFPDIIFNPPTALRDILDRLEVSRAEVVLGLFPARPDQRADIVELDRQGWVRQIHIKTETDLPHGWILAAWTPAFSHFLHEFVAGHVKTQGEALEENELYLGHVIQAAIHAGFLVDSVIFERGWFVDIGTSEGLQEALAWAGEV